MGRAATLPAPADAVTVARLFNAWQRDFPLVARPFDAIGQAVGMDGEQVRGVLRQGLARGEISRVGAVFGVGAGGSALLCAMQVPERRLDAVVARVNAEPGVSHNYTREHRLNLWFVASAPDAARLQACVDGIEQFAALQVLRLPMRRAYRIDLGFDLYRETHCARTPQALDAPPVPPALRALAAGLEHGLELVDRPYAALGEHLDLDEREVIGILRQWCAQGTLRRLGVVLRHHEFGISANAMVVFAPHAHEIDAAGTRLAAQAGVNLCYRRASAPDWPYTLYCMVHGRERDTVRALIASAVHAAGLGEAPREVLFSTRRHKQTGSRYFSEAAA